MSEREHTPTPWKCVGYTRFFYLEGPGEQTPLICRCYRNPAMEGNARFIERAVNAHDDLLDVCQDLIVCANTHGLTDSEWTGPSETLNGIVDRARAAIAKAKP